jgi:hypothetical protein
MYLSKIAFVLGFLALIPQYLQIINTEDVNSFSLISVFLSISSFALWTYININHNYDNFHIMDSVMNLIFFVTIFVFIILQRLGKRRKGQVTDDDRWIKESFLRKLF